MRTLKHVLGHNGLVTCECGRTTNADMVADLTVLPGPLLNRVQLTGKNLALMCDACRERLRLTDPQRHAALMVKLAALQ